MVKTFLKMKYITLLLMISTIAFNVLLGQNIKFNNISAQNSDIESNLINCITIDRSNNILVASDLSFYFYTDTSKVVISELKEINICKIDKDDKKWLGSYRGFIYVLDNNFVFVDTISITTCNASKTNCLITDIEFYEDTVWVSTLGAGIYKITNNKKRVKPEKVMPHSLPKKVYDLEINERTIWIASETGLYSISEFNRLTKYKELDIATKITIHDKKVYVSGIKNYQSKIYSYFNGKYSELILNDDIINSKINDFVFDQNDNIYIGSDNFVKINLKSNEYTIFNETNSFTSTHISDIFLKDSTFWIATKDNGIYTTFSLFSDTLKIDSITTYQNKIAQFKDTTKLDIFTNDTLKIISNDTIIFNNKVVNIGDTIMLDNILFDKGSAVITDKTSIDSLYAFLIKYPDIFIEISGHTEANKKNFTQRQIDYHYNLSLKRVEAVQKYLVSNGIIEKRVDIKAYGGTKPISKHESLNRRVEMRILSITKE